MLGLEVNGIYKPSRMQACAWGGPCFGSKIPPLYRSERGVGIVANPDLLGTGWRDGLLRLLAPPALVLPAISYPKSGGKSLQGYLQIPKPFCL